MKNMNDKTLQSILDSFDEKFWYDTDSLRLCQKDVPQFDEDDNFECYRQDAAAVPRDIKQFISDACKRYAKEKEKEMLKTCKKIYGREVIKILKN